MKISELIKKLQEIKDEYGDLEVTRNEWPIDKNDLYYDEENNSLDICY